MIISNLYRNIDIGYVNSLRTIGDILDLPSNSIFFPDQPYIRRCSACILCLFIIISNTLIIKIFDKWDQNNVKFSRETELYLTDDSKSW